MFTKDETKIIRSPRIDAIRVHIKACKSIDFSAQDGPEYRYLVNGVPYTLFKGEKQQFVVLTVHDLGCNHTMWLNFLNHSSMAEIVRRAAFLHVDLPGQHDGAEPLPPDYAFPTMQMLGEDLLCVLENLNVNQVVCLGEGAGANILARFAIAHPDRVLGACLIHCTATTAGFMEAIKDKIIGWKLEHIGMNPTTEHYLVLHRFGSFEKAQNKEELMRTITAFQDQLKSKINPQNLNRFVNAFMKRTNITDSLSKLSCPLLVVTGAKASFNHTVHTFYDKLLKQMDPATKKNVEFLEIEDVANVIEEKPERLAEGFLYLCQGIGVVGGVPMPRVQQSGSHEGDIRLRQRSMSMEEADMPKGIYSTSPTRFGSPAKSSNIAMSSSPGKSSPMSTSPPKN